MNKLIEPKPGDMWQTKFSTTDSGVQFCSAEVLDEILENFGQCPYYDIIRYISECRTQNQIAMDSGHLSSEQHRRNFPAPNIGEMIFVYRVQKYPGTQMLGWGLPRFRYNLRVLTPNQTRACIWGIGLQRFNTVFNLVGQKMIKT